MSGDLEDFLRRAAQRRQQKAAAQQQRSAAPSGKRRPQYTNVRAERVVSPVETDEVLTAEIVEEEDSNSFAARMKRLEQAKKAAKEAESAVATAAKAGPSPSTVQALFTSANPADDLIALLRQPGGIQRAILLREILDRPQHRW